MAAKLKRLSILYFFCFHIKVDCRFFYLFQVITIGKERYTVGEALFQPSILGLEAHGIVEQLVRSISAVSSDNHRQLLENTVLCGGTVSMTGEFINWVYGMMFISAMRSR